MQITFRKILCLSPFSEDNDRFVAGRVFGGYTTLLFGAIVTALLTVASVVLTALRYMDEALNVIAVAVAASALTAGIEWHAGLRMRAANQLFASVILASIIVFARTLL